MTGKGVEVAQGAMEKVIRAIEEADYSPFVLAAYKSGRPMDSWSGLNRLMCVLEGTQDARGYKQWQKVGRHVKAGSKAIYILVPLVIKVKEKVINEAGEVEERERPFIKGFRGVPVFKYEDTEGEPLPEIEVPKIPANLQAVADKIGVKVRFENFNGQEYGYFSPMFNNIVLKSPEMEVACHELSHAVDMKVLKAYEGYEDGEFVAELSAAILCSMFGFDFEAGRVKTYIKSWKPDSVKEIRREVKLLERVLKVVEWIYTVATTGEEPKPLSSQEPQ